MASHAIFRGGPAAGPDLKRGPGTGRAWARVALPAALTLAGGSACAQAAGNWRIVPLADATVSIIDSTLVGGTDVVTTVSPGVHLTNQTGRLRATVDYSLAALHHSRRDTNQAQGDTLQNTLNAVVNAELLERVLFVDTTARINQQSISPYGQQSVNGYQANANRTEVSQVAVQPYTRGRLSDLAVYQLSLNADATNAKNSAAASSRSTGSNFSLSSANTSTRFGWNALVTTQRTFYRGNSNANDTARVSLGVQARPDVDLSLGLRGGQETASSSSLYSQRYNNWGGDLRWVPSNRTSASVAVDNRYFGRSYQASLDHRMSRSSLRFSINRDVTNGAGAYGAGQPVTIYQLLYNQFANLEPDPALRDQLVRSYLLAINLDPNARVAGGFLNGGTTLQRREDLALSYTGLRTTLTVQAFASDSRRIDSNATALEQEPVRQMGLTTGLSYRLSPTGTLTLTGARLRTLGNLNQDGNQLTSIATAWTQQLGRYLSTSLAVRHAIFNGPINPYHETSLSGTLGLRF